VKPGILAGLARSLARTASDVLGSDSLHIDGGGGVEAIRGDISRGEDYPDDVAEPESTLQVVVTTEEFLSEYSDPALSYVNKLANYAGEDFRIAGITENGGLYTIALRDDQQGI
jgi:hypothetical protein